MDCVGCGSRWVNLLTEPVQFVMMTRLSWIDLPSACQSTIGLNVSCATVVANSRAQAAMRFPVLISLDFLFGGKRPPQTKPPVAYQSSAVQYTCSFRLQSRNCNVAPRLRLRFRPGVGPDTTPSGIIGRPGLHDVILRIVLYCTFFVSISMIYHTVYPELSGMD